MGDQLELFELPEAESIVARSRVLSDRLFKETMRMPEWRRVLSTRERCAKFEEKVSNTGSMLNRKLEKPLPDHIVAKVVERVVERVAAWEHSPIRQRERQAKMVKSQNRKSRGRDGRIIYAHECGESLASIARQYDMSKGGVYHIIDRERRRRAAEDAGNDTSATG